MERIQGFLNVRSFYRSNVHARFEALMKYYSAHLANSLSLRQTVSLPIFVYIKGLGRHLAIDRGLKSKNVESLLNEAPNTPIVTSLFSRNRRYICWNSKANSRKLLEPLAPRSFSLFYATSIHCYLCFYCSLCIFVLYLFSIAPSCFRSAISSLFVICTISSESPPPQSFG
jgi:hypothetical protein